MIDKRCLKKGMVRNKENFQWQISNFLKLFSQTNCGAQYQTAAVQNFGTDSARPLHRTALPQCRAGQQGAAPRRRPWRRTPARGAPRRRWRGPASASPSGTSPTSSAAAGGPARRIPRPMRYGSSLRARTIGGGVLYDRFVPGGSTLGFSLVGGGHATRRNLPWVLVQPYREHLLINSITSVWCVISRVYAVFPSSRSSWSN